MFLAKNKNSHTKNKHALFLKQTQHSFGDELQDLILSYLGDFQGQLVYFALFIDTNQKPLVVFIKQKTVILGLGV